jgi:hypothetical protein
MRRRPSIIIIAGAVGGVFAAGLFIPGRIGGALLLLTDAVLIAMARLTWMQARPQGRPFRVIVMVGIAALAAYKLAGGR